jgi:hypothetical protein
MRPDYPKIAGALYRPTAIVACGTAKQRTIPARHVEINS